MIARWAKRALSPITAEQRARQEYCEKLPHPQNALDLFSGEWASKLPPPLDTLSAGLAPLFEDDCVKAALARLGDLTGRRILELGPLEGGHTYLMDRAGAAEVIAIEANPHAFLKCLVVKELLGMKAARFLHGDFVRYLCESSERFDVVLASGVLYHMTEPVELMARFAAVTDVVYLWTHYYDAGVFSARPPTAAHVVAPERGQRMEYQGFGYTRYRQDYGEHVANKRFFGGTERFSYWLTRDDILGALRHCGFANVDIITDHPAHPHGPVLALLARR